MSDLHSEIGNHQEQVKVLIEKTASSLDNTALKMLFVSVQQNNIDLCVQYAINKYVIFPLFMRFDIDFFFSLADKIGVLDTVCSRHVNPNDRKAKFDTGAFGMVCAVMVWACICEWILNSWTGIHYGIVTSECQHKICKYLPSLKSIIY